MEPPELDNSIYSKHDQLKKVALEKILGPMHKIVGHAIVAFAVGGSLDMYRFPNALDGTAFATMELIEPDGSGPIPSEIGTYELVAFTKYKIDVDLDDSFNQAQLRIWSMMTSIARLSFNEILNPMDTCEVPGKKDEPFRCVVLDTWEKPGVDFQIGDQKHGLLLCMEIFRSEMEYAIQNGSPSLFRLLREKTITPIVTWTESP
jgi:hypothetical protein